MTVGSKDEPSYWKPVVVLVGDTADIPSPPGDHCTEYEPDPPVMVIVVVWFEYIGYDQTRLESYAV